MAISQQKIDSFCERFKDEKGLKIVPPPEIRVLNPGPKGEDSILDKMKRHIEIWEPSGNEAKGKWDPTCMDKMNDLNRFTMVINNLDEANDLMDKLKDAYADLHGHILDNSETNGYRGIHLTFVNKHGVETEIQLHTPESFQVKQMTEVIHTKWRGVDVSKCPERQPEYDEDLAYGRDLSDQAHLDGKFAEYKAEWKEKFKQWDRQKENTADSKITPDEFRIPVAGENGKLPEAFAKEVIRKCLPYLQESQNSVFPELEKIHNQHIIESTQGTAIDDIGDYVQQETVQEEQQPEQIIKQDDDGMTM